MVAQETYGWWGNADDTFGSWEMTVQVKSRDTMIEVAMTGWWDDGDLPSGYIGISEIISSSGVETFVSPGYWGATAYAQARMRYDVTAVRVQIACLDSFVRGRLMLHFWS